MTSFPTAEERQAVSPVEWDAYLESWNSLLQKLLTSSLLSFNEQTKELGSMISSFLCYFFEETALRHPVSSQLSLTEELRRRCFFLVHRFYTEADRPSSLVLLPDCLADLCVVYSRFPGLDSLISSVWRQEHLDSDPGALESKAALVRKLEVRESGSDFGQCLYRVAALLGTSEHYGRFLMQGSDFFDALRTPWNRGSASVRQKICKITYRCLLSLMQRGSSNMTLLLDHLYSLKADHAVTSKARKASLLVDMLSHTPFFRKFRRSVFESDIGRAKSMQADLEVIISTFDIKQKAFVRATSMKDNSNQAASGNRANEAYVRESPSFRQMNELFPEQSDKSLASLLIRFENNVDMAIAHLLDEPLPAYSETKQQAQKVIVRNEASEGPQLPAKQLPIRRNVFDDDDLSTLRVPESHLHQGRREKGGSLSSTAVAKEAILSALAAIDTDSDERDDTYDVGDVGGTIDTTMQSEGLDQNEAALFAAWKSSPAAFARDAATRRSQGRMALRKETGMTDEAIEGWGVMLRRDPKKIRRLEEQSSMFAGEQNELKSTAWRAGQDEEEGRSDEDNSGLRTMRGGHGMTRGRRPDGGSSGAQDTAAPAGPSSQRERHRKEVHKGSRANHNRKNQRARKTARAGFAQ